MRSVSWRSAQPIFRPHVRTFGLSIDVLAEMERHAEALASLCSVCGRKFASLSRSITYPVLEFAVELAHCLGVDVQHDSADTHPPRICHLCKKTVERYRHAESAGCSFSHACTPSIVWAPHRRGQPCAICSLAFDCRRGRPPKKKRQLFGAALHRSSGDGGVDDAEDSVARADSSDSPSQQSCHATLALDVDPVAIDVDDTDRDQELRTESSYSGAVHPGSEERRHLLTTDRDDDDDDDREHLPAHPPSSEKLDADASAADDRCGVDCLLEDVLRKATPQYKTDEEELCTERFLSTVHDDFQCPICKLVVDQAIEAPSCERVFCTACIWQWLLGADTCPLCKRMLTTQQLRQPSTMLQRVLPQLEIRCDFAEQGCQQPVRLALLRRHTADCQQHRASTDGQTYHPNVITPSSSVQDILSLSPSKPLNTTMERVVTSLIQRKERHGGTSGQIEVQTGGTPQTLLKTTRARVPTGECTPRHERRRTTEIQQVRQVLAGGKEGAKNQQAAELRVLSKSSQDDLLVAAGIKPPPGQVGASCGLAIKADLRLPWFQMRKLTRWLKHLGLSMQSERAMREYIAEELPFELLAERIPLSVRKSAKEQSIEERPVVRFQDLCQLVMHYIKQHSDAGQLTWHDGAIPATNLSVKLGGDHGGGSFKMSFQLANAPSPNAVKNTVVFLAASAKDTYSNLCTLLQPFTGEVLQLSTSVFEMHRVRVTMFGDYELQTTLYGLSGSSGVHPCLHCTITKADKQKPAGNRSQTAEKRTLDSLASDYQAFQDAGAVLANAKKFHNVIRPAILPIPVEDVCIPALHLDLGIFPYLYYAFVHELRRVDLHMAEKMRASADDGEVFRRAAASFEAVVQMERRLTAAKEEANATAAQVRK